LFNYFQRGNLHSFTNLVKQSKTKQSMKHVIFSALFLVSSALLAQESKELYLHQNLGENINSKYTELTPRISADGQTMFYVRDGHPDNKNQQDIWYSQKDSLGNWKPAVRANDNINQLPANCVWSVNADGKTLLIRGAYNKRGLV
jgi:OOP family OmpA-OmpF porin